MGFVGALWRPKDEEEYKELIAVVDRDRCIGCKKCLQICDLLGAAGRLEVEDCYGCGESRCVSACEQGARVLIPKRLYKASKERLSSADLARVVADELGQLPIYGIQVDAQLLQVVAARMGLSNADIRVFIPRRKQRAEFAWASLPKWCETERRGIQEHHGRDVFRKLPLAHVSP